MSGVTGMNAIDLTVRCDGCGLEKPAKPTRKGKARLPKGWKKLRSERYCPTCRASLYRLRALTFPVATVEGGMWKEFCQALKACWARSTHLANWCLQELHKAEPRRAASDEKMHAAPDVNLYQLWQDHHERANWNGSSAAANSVIHATRGKWLKTRKSVMWFNESAPPTFRFPFPYPVDADAWTPLYIETDGGKRPAVRTNLGGLTWTIQLRGGHEFRRQLAGFAQLISGEAVKGELAIYRKRSHGSHRRTGEAKEAGGGARVATRIMVKLVAYLPVRVGDKARSEALEVVTKKGCLLCATGPHNADRPWLYHANYMRHWVRVYQWKRQNIADDTKAEKRRPKRNARQTNDYYRTIAVKYGNRMTTFCDRLSKMLVAFADRSGYAAVVYDDREKTYVNEFPWATLRDMIQRKARDAGLSFTHVASADVADGEAEDTREEGKDDQT